ncbi:MAG: hypothetical protein V8R15_00030 [Bacilli bacterium]
MIFDTAPLIVVSDSMTIEKDESGNIISGAFNKNDLIFIKKTKSYYFKRRRYYYLCCKGWFNCNP